MLHWKILEMSQSFANWPVRAKYPMDEGHGYRRGEPTPGLQVMFINVTLCCLIEMPCLEDATYLQDCVSCQFFLSQTQHGTKLNFFFSVFSHL